MNRLESKSVVITGAASGIGRAAAQLMAAEGAKVLVADLDPARAEEAAVAIRETGGNALGFGVDVMNEDSLAAMIEKAVANSAASTSCVITWAVVTRARISTCSGWTWTSGIA